MDTLIALGTGSAWFYSCIVIDYSAQLPPLSAHAYFEASAVILAFINLGSAWRPVPAARLRRRSEP